MVKHFIKKSAAKASMKWVKGCTNGLEYDYVMAREHVNPITNLVTLIHYYFEDYRETWWPARIPFSDINLIYAVNIRR